MWWLAGDAGNSSTAGGWLRLFGRSLDFAGYQQRDGASGRAARAEERLQHALRKAGCSDGDIEQFCKDDDDDDDSAECVITAHGAVPDNETVNTAAIQSAIDACHRGLLVNGQHPGLLKKTAELLEHEARWDEAADFWSHLCAISKPTPNIHLRIGLCRLRHGDDDPAAARAEFEKALEIDPDHEAATFALAERLDAGGECDEVIRRLERLAKAKPDSARVPLTLANFLRKYDRLEEAVAQWRAGLAKAPEWDDSWRDLGLGLGLGELDIIGHLLDVKAHGIS